ncbi:MAG: 4-hydroxy-3-methylbut-2-enyl diphosphate reductase [Planctomycetaceae bacterium]|jgi:4-hydroxy-3-methylbut-2-enyl diphosphate reductase|nr:4-hydroxy-3-methylbut-2-enyl diphosphate reductase [Planctomycetaceae bacterium]
MHLILANPRGFCAGVKTAISALNTVIERYGTPVYVYHEIVHNTWVVSDFCRRGVVFVNAIDDVPAGSRLMFSAHGVSPEIRRTAAERNIETVDATCPLVAKVHREVIRNANEGRNIVLLGHRGHDEIIGIMSEAPEYIRIVETERDIETLTFEKDEPLVFLTQTTLSVSETEQMLAKIRQRYPNITGGKTDICYATQNRQDAVRELSKDCDVVLVVGSRTSSNSRRLAEQAENFGICSYLVDGPDDITAGWFCGNETVLITAGASAPENVVQSCVAVLKERFNAVVEEKTVRQENVVFRLPKL